MSRLTVEQIEKLNELVEDVTIAMLTTRHESSLRSRPMWTKDCDEKGELWFLTSKDSAKTCEIEEAAHVNVAYSNPSKETYVSVSGLASLVDDPAKKEELWSPSVKVWFESPHDPKLQLIRVQVQGVEYWDTPGGKLVSLFGWAKSLITGEKDMLSENRTFKGASME